MLTDEQKAQKRARLLAIRDELLLLLKQADEEHTMFKYHTDSMVRVSKQLGDEASKLMEELK
jgi:hypothetical protein